MNRKVSIRVSLSSPITPAYLQVRIVERNDIVSLRNEFWNLTAAAPKRDSLQQAQRCWIVSTLQKSSDFQDVNEPIIRYYIGRTRVCRKFYQKALPISQGRMTNLIKEILNGRNDDFR